MATDQELEAGIIRRCRPEDRAEMLRVVNAAAEAYRGVIPPECWREPYMAADELAAEVADGVAFVGCDAPGGLCGVMGVQRRGGVDLVRHAYVLPGRQGRGVGSALLADLRAGSDRPTLVGTWRAAGWAVRFYERHGFARVDDDGAALLLRAYWTVPERQVAASVVLSSPALERFSRDLNRSGFTRARFSDSECLPGAEAGRHGSSAVT